MRHTAKTIAFAASLAVASILPAKFAVADQAAAPQLSDVLRDSQNRQDQLRVQTQKVAGQLDTIIAEFARNGLQDSNDVKTLVKVRAILSRLSDREMAQVIASLQTARQESGSAALHDAAAAHTEQKNIITQLDAIIHEYQRQAALGDLASRFSALAERQGVNLKYVYHTVKDSAGHDRHEFADSVQIQVNEQNSLKDEVAAAVSDLADAAKSADTDDSARLKSGTDLVASSHLTDQVGGASSDLTQWHLFQAAGEEMNARNTMLELARLIAAPEDTVSKLKTAEKQIDAAIADQQAAAEDAKAGNFNDAADKQFDAVSRTDETRKDIQNVAPTAAEKMKKAMDPMQQARQNIDQKHADPAQQNQKDATAQLQDAKQQVAQELARQEAEAKNDQPTDNLARLQQLKKDADALKKDEQAAQSQTQAAKTPEEQKEAAQQQGAMEQKAQDIQQKAADASKDAAAAMAEAARQMDKAQSALDPKKGADPQAAQQREQAAVASIDQANKDLDKDIAKLQQDQKDEKAVDQSLIKLAQLIEAQQKINLDTGLVAVPGPKSIKTPAPADVATAQTKNSTDTDAFKGTLPDSATDAKTPLTDAKQNMDSASTNLGGQDVKTAVPPEKDALADLYKAKELLEAKRDDLNQELGKTADAQQQEKDQQKLAQDLDKAQQQLADASANLPQNQAPQNQPPQDQPPQDQDQQTPTGQLQQEQKQIAQTIQKLEQQPNNSDQTKQDLKQAAKAADDAAQNLADNKLPQAVQDMEKAKQDLQAADPSAQQADAGQPDAGKPDAGKPDAGKPDAGKPDAGKPDAGKPDAGKPDQNGKPDAGQPKPDSAMQAVAQHQQDVMSKTQTMAAQQQLADLAKKLGDMAAQDNAPPAAEQAMTQAQQALADAAAQAHADPSAAQADAAQAQAALAQAQAAMAMAQSGLAQADQPGDKPSKPDPKSSDENSTDPSKGERKTWEGNGPNEGGPRGGAKAGAAFVGLPARDRQALQQSQADKYPQAYGQMVEQYRRNLSDGDQN